MTPRQAELGREIVRAVPGNPVVLGTFGLVLHGLLACQDAADVDVLARFDDVRAIGAALLRAGFAVTSWQDEIRDAAALDESRLKGRVYLRGARDGVVVDVTYEGIDVELWRSDAVALADGVVVASVERIVDLKRARNAAKDQRILALLPPEYVRTEA
jgi:hypothetical protein